MLPLSKVLLVYILYSVLLSLQSPLFAQSSNVEVLIQTNMGASIILDGTVYKLGERDDQISIFVEQRKLVDGKISLRINKVGHVPFETSLTASNINSAGFISINKNLRSDLSRVSSPSSRRMLVFAVLGFIFLTLFVFSLSSNSKLKALPGKLKSILKNLDPRVRRKPINRSSTKFTKPGKHAPGNPEVIKAKLNPQYEQDSNYSSEYESTDDIGLKLFDKFEGYKIIEKIGEGGVSKVYKAVDDKGYTVALKLMTSYLHDFDMTQKFIAEGWVIRQLNQKYPKAPIVKVHDFGRGENDPHKRPFIAMELLYGDPLSKIIPAITGNGGNYWPLRIFKPLTIQLLDALDAIHGFGIIHRDLAPDNMIYVPNELELTLIDFGVVWHEIEGLKGSSYGASYGKPEFMSPEQFGSSENIDYRSDYYSMGVVLFTLMNGTPPFQHENIFKVGDMHRNNPVPELPPQVPDNYKTLIHKLLSKRPEDRPSSTSEIRSLLN